MEVDWMSCASPIAVLGGGHGAHCMAADLTLQGHRVNMYEHPNCGERFRETLERGQIKLTGIGARGTARLHLVTTDIRQAMREAEIVNLVVPALAHEAFFAEMIPCLRDGQLVVVWAGDFGSLRLRELIRRERPELKVTVVETNTLPYGARLTGPAEVELLLAAPRVTVAALPATRTAQILGCLRPFWPVLEAAPNVVVAALSNPNPICHPPGSLLNTGRIQYSGGQFYMYREGITEAVARVIRMVYEETASLARALGYEVLQYQERDFRTPGSIMAVAFQAPFDTQTVIGNVLGPKSIQDRYIVEDLPYGLVPMSQLGDVLGVETPLIDAIVTIGSAVCGIDFWKTGRTLEQLGLAGRKAQSLKRLVEEGE